MVIYMDFKDILNRYIELVGCSSKQLANDSGLSATVISRYRNGDRIPKLKSKQLEAIIVSLEKLALNNNSK
mgnify:CR=1 FL=1